MKLYREVPVSERLPDAEGRYIVGNGLTWFEASYSYNYSFHEEFTDCSGVVAWLEVVELPTDEEVKRTAYEFQQKSSIMDDDAYSFRRGVNWLKERRFDYLDDIYEARWKHINIY